MIQTIRHSIRYFKYRRNEVAFVLMPLDVTGQEEERFQIFPGPAVSLAASTLAKPSQRGSGSVSTPRIAAFAIGQEPRRLKRDERHRQSRHVDVRLPDIRQLDQLGAAGKQGPYAFIEKGSESPMRAAGMPGVTLRMHGTISDLQYQT
jgi:hypothetical protein